MPTGKRASMREGPLAALFRRTTEDQASDSPAADAPARQAAQERAGRTTAAAGPAPPRPAGGRWRSRSRASPRPRSACARPSPPTSRRACSSGPRPPRPPAAHGDRAGRSLRRDLHASGTDGQPGHPRRRSRRRRRQRGQPDGRGRGRGRRVPGHQHRPSVPSALGGPRDAAHRRDRDPGLGSGADPTLGTPGRARGLRPDQVDAPRLGHGVHRRRRRRRHRHRGGADRGPHRPRLGALTVGIVTRPFDFEGSRRRDAGRGRASPPSRTRSTR